MYTNNEVSASRLISPNSVDPEIGRPLLTITFTPIPERAAVTLLGLGACCLGLTRRGRRKDG